MTVNRRAQRDLPDPPVQLDPPGLQAQLVRWDPPVPPESQVLPGLPDLQDLQDLLASRVLRARRQTSHR